MSTNAIRAADMARAAKSMFASFSWQPEFITQPARRRDWSLVRANDRTRPPGMDVEVELVGLEQWYRNEFQFGDWTLVVRSLSCPVTAVICVPNARDEQVRIRVHNQTDAEFDAGFAGDLSSFYFALRWIADHLTRELGLPTEPAGH